MVLVFVGTAFGMGLGGVYLYAMSRTLFVKTLAYVEEYGFNHPLIDCYSLSQDIFPSHPIFPP
jgi:hypothetical protein